MAPGVKPKIGFFLLAMLEWSTTVFQVNLLKFKKTEDYHDYQIKLVLDILQK